ncbi:RDD family protein [Nocardioides sp.]|uniref:RDD family protein n=1 Tax=Nocardioides sp. TaxID=35761 RepID=UPI0027371DA7|nr:RDD family protein [Nocardioides sp.]MDP3891288.1 RDD family protein [Nocardioides sp.]
MSEMPTPGYGTPTPPGGVRPGELLDRFLARLIDGVILAIAYVLVGVVVGVAISSVTGWFISNLISTVLTVAIGLGYFAFLESSQGQTVGKMAMKLRVMGPDGGLPTLEQSLRRNVFMAFNLAGIVPIIGSVIGGLATLAAVIMIAVGISNDTVRRQAWHDQFAGGTYVVKEG